MTAPGRLTAPRAAAGLLLALAASVWLVLRAAAPLGPAPATPPDLSAVATEFPVTPDGFYATQQAGDLATSFARATAQPFPTPRPAALQTGQPASVSVQRGGLTLLVRLSKNTYLAGEAGLANISLTNAGSDTVVVTGQPFNLVLLDAQGHLTPPWPWQDSLVFSIPPYIQSLAPGQSLTGTLGFHVPQSATGLALWVASYFGRASLSHPEGPDNVSLRLEAGPLPLQVLPPAPDRQLRAELHADRTHWSLRVTDAAGHIPPGPYTVGLEAASANIMLGGSFTSDRMLGAAYGLDNSGDWSRSWDADMGTGPLQVHVWVGAPGYVATLASVFVPGPGEPSHAFNTYALPWHTFATFRSAQAALGIPLYRLNAEPGAAAFDSLQATVDAGFGDINVQQMYRLPGGAWLELDQYHLDPPNAANWGDARYDDEAQALSLAGQPAYLDAAWGWWRLDWQIGPDAFELHAPVGALPPADLLALAASVRP